MAKVRKLHLLFLIAVIGALSALQLWGLAIDYADSTASSNMVDVRLLDFELDPTENGTLFARVHLGITNPARGHVNITYISYQLVSGGEYVTGGSRVFSPDYLVLNPLSSVDIRLTLDVPATKSQAVLHEPRKNLELLVFLTTKTSYGVGTLSFAFVP